MRTFLLLFTVAACSDSDDKSVIPGDDTGMQDTQSPDTDTDSSTETGDSSVEDICGDWEGTLEEDPQCVQTEVEGEMKVELAWSVSEFIHFPEHNEILMTPLVVDIDGDGEREVVAIGDHDDNDDGTRGTLHIVDGDGDVHDSTGFLSVTLAGSEYVHYPYRFTNLAAGDVDQDGQMELVMMVEQIIPEEGTPPECDPILPPPPPPMEEDIQCFAASVDAEANIEWISERAFECGAHAPALVDLEGDGTIEVLIGPAIMEGASGKTRFWIDENSGNGRFDAYAEIGYHTVASDLDGDGQAEVIAGSSVYKANGTPYCNVNLDGQTGPAVDGFSAPFRPAEGEAAVYALVGNGMLRIIGSDCSIQTSVTLDGSGNGGPPTVADFTGDGTPDIAVANSSTVGVYTLDGTLVWSEPITDLSSHALGLLAFDFEGDGRMELVYGDEVALHIRDGETGKSRFSDPSHTSRTAHEYPVIADVDHDGQPELIVPNGGSHNGSPATGFYALEGTDPLWLGGPEQWNQHAYDGVSPTRVATPSDRFRSADQNADTGGLATNLVALAELCNHDPDSGTVDVFMAIGNTGAIPAKAGLISTVYETGPDGYAVPLWHFETPNELAPGEVYSPPPKTVRIDDLKHRPLLLKVDDNDGAEGIRECDETDNETMLYWEEETTE